VDSRRPRVASIEIEKKLFASRRVKNNGKIKKGGCQALHVGLVCIRHPSHMNRGALASPTPTDRWDQAKHG